MLDINGIDNSVKTLHSIKDSRLALRAMVKRDVPNIDCMTIKRSRIRNINHIFQRTVMYGKG
jgi:hypothetical protein